MNTEYIDEVLRSIDPARNQAAESSRSREDAIWHSIVQSLAEDGPIPLHRYEFVGAVGTTATAAAILLAALIGSPLDAAATTLNAAAKVDAHAAVLAPLAAGEYYYQEAQVSLTCQVSSPSMSHGEAPLTYVSDGTMQSWSTASGPGKVVITPSVVDGSGSHFATPADEERWNALGKPFIPCALVSSSNELGGNAANSDTDGSLGGYSTTVSGYGGFGISLALASRTTLVSAVASINNLPNSSAYLASLLANGQLGPDGTLSATAQVCPILDSSSNSPVGCTPTEQLSIIEQLIQLPDASAKLGSVLYQVIANLPGAEVVDSTTTTTGSVGTTVVVPQGTGESFEVVLNSTTGALISCSELLTQNGTTVSIGSIEYGPVQVVQGQGNPVSAASS